MLAYFMGAMSCDFMGGHLPLVVEGSLMSCDVKATSDWNSWEGEVSVRH